MKKALVTGALGQDGSYLCEHLVSLGYRVYGLARKPSFASNWWVEWAQDIAKSAQVEFIYGDMRDELSLRNAIRKAWPDEIYNLAGQVYVPLSWDDAAQTFDSNVGGLARILKIVEQTKSDTKVYQASSSEMVGNFEGMFAEETEMRPTSPYGISKLAAHKLVALYRQRGLYVVAGILSNHESPRRGHEMVTRKIARAVAAWSAGDETVLAMGSLASRRDWGFAGEYVKAMHLMLQQIEPTDYVVGTGVSHSVEDFLSESCLAAGINGDFLKGHLRTDERLVRGTQEIYDLRADTSKIERIIGWRPKVGFKELVRMMVKAEQLKLKPKGLGIVVA